LNVLADPNTEASSPATCTECLNSSAPIENIDVWKMFGMPPQKGLCPSQTDPQQIKDPNYKKLQAEWTDYQHAMNLRVAINSKIISTSRYATISGATADFIKSLNSLQNFIAIMDRMDAKGYFQIIKANRNFKQLIHDKDFLQALRDLTDDQMTSDKDDKNIQTLFNNPDFLAYLSSLRTELKNPEVMKAMDKVIDNGLTFLDSEPRKNAIQLSKILFEKNGAQIIADIDAAKNPLIKDLTFPRDFGGPFFEQYKALITDDTSAFIENFSPTVEEIKSIMPARKFTDAEIEGIQRGSAPVAVNIVDEWILPYFKDKGTVQLNISGKKLPATESQLQAIDAVARTILGESSICGDPLAQMDAVGRVIADRSLSVKKAIAQKKFVDAQNFTMKETFLHSGAGFFADTKIKSILWATNPYRGANEFGRPEKPELDTAAQVVTRPDQFSVWRSFNESRTTLNNLNPSHNLNIPNTPVIIQGPQSTNDTRSLLNAVCPDQYSVKWQKALKLATQIVLDPDDYVRRHQWVSSESNVFFYTHDDTILTWAREVKIDSMKIIDENGKTSIKPLRPASGDGICQSFKTFVPNNGGKY
jgi:hypothetical protein